jgi:hypothetical protein
MPAPRFILRFILFSLFLVKAAIGSYAQENRLKKGSLCIGGSMGFHFSWQLDSLGGKKFEREQNIYRIKVIPAMQYFLSDHFSVGFGAGLDLTKTKFPSAWDGSDAFRKSVYVSFVPSLNYYKLLAGETFGLLLSAQVPYSHLFKRPNYSPFFQNDPTIPYRENSWSMGLRINMGLFFFPSKNWMLQASVANLFSFTRSVFKEEIRGNYYDGTFVQNEVRGLDFKSQGLSLSAYYFLGKQKVD